MRKLNSLKGNSRNKALFGALVGALGATGAASLIGSGINAIGNLIGSGINAWSSNKQAKSEAEAIEASSKQQAKDAAEMRKLQTQLNTDQMNLLKSEFERRRQETMRDNINNVLQGAAESEEQMRKNAAIQVRNGGSIKPKRRRLRASYRENIPGISFPDKGGAQVLGYTPNGIIAILRGPSHNNGGIDVDTNGRKGVEAEGGELMKVEYQNGGNVNDVKFISKHDLPGSGFNPAESVLAGVMTPDEAFSTQEYIKDMNGISDDGRAKYGIKSTLRRMKCGGRRKAPNGTYYLSGGLRGNTYGNLLPYSGTTYGPTDNNSGWSWNNLNDVEKNNLAGAGFTFAGNLLATGLNAWSNWSNARRLANAQRYATSLMSETYKNLPVIDANFLDSVKHANAIAVTQAPNYIDRYSRTANERSLHRTLRDIDRNTFSSAAAANRKARAEINAGDVVTRIAENEAKVNQGIAQNNIAIINDTIQKNAASENQFNSQLAAIKADLMSERVRQQRENFIGGSSFDAEGKINIAQTLAGANQQNWANLAGTLASGANGIGNALATNAKMRFETQNALLGASDDAVLRYLYSGNNGIASKEVARAMYLRYRNGTSEQKQLADKLSKDFGPF